MGSHSERDRTRLRDMLQYSREAVSLARGRTRSDLDDDRLLNLALVRLMEVVGEAASRVSAAGRDEYPGIPWSRMTNMRNRLIHGYDVVDMDILWQTLQGDLPALIGALEGILGPEPE